MKFPKKTLWFNGNFEKDKSQFSLFLINDLTLKKNLSDLTVFESCFTIWGIRILIGMVGNNIRLKFPYP